MIERIQELLDELLLLDPAIAVAFAEDLETTAATSEQVEDVLVQAIERRTD